MNSSTTENLKICVDNDCGFPYVKCHKIHLTTRPKKLQIFESQANTASPTEPLPNQLINENNSTQVNSASTSSASSSIYSYDEKINSCNYKNTRRQTNYSSSKGSAHEELYKPICTSPKRSHLSLHDISSPLKENASFGTKLPTVFELTSASIGHPKPMAESIEAHKSTPESIEGQEPTSSATIFQVIKDIKKEKFETQDPMLATEAGNGAITETVECSETMPSSYLTTTDDNISRETSSLVKPTLFPTFEDYGTEVKTNDKEANDNTEILTAKFIFETATASSLNIEAQLVVDERINTTQETFESSDVRDPILAQSENGPSESATHSGDNLKDEGQAKDDVIFIGTPDVILVKICKKSDASKFKKSRAKLEKHPKIAVTGVQARPNSVVSDQVNRKRNFYTNQPLPSLPQPSSLPPQPPPLLPQPSISNISRNWSAQSSTYNLAQPLSLTHSTNYNEARPTNISPTQPLNHDIVSSNWSSHSSNWHGYKPQSNGFGTVNHWYQHDVSQRASHFDYGPNYQSGNSYFYETQSYHPFYNPFWERSTSNEIFRPYLRQPNQNFQTRQNATNNLRQGNRRIGKARRKKRKNQVRCKPSNPATTTAKKGLTSGHTIPIRNITVLSSSFVPAKDTGTKVKKEPVDSSIPTTNVNFKCPTPDRNAKPSHATVAGINESSTLGTNLKVEVKQEGYNYRRQSSERKRKNVGVNFIDLTAHGSPEKMPTTSNVTCGTDRYLKYVSGKKKQGDVKRQRKTLLKKTK